MHPCMNKLSNVEPYQPLLSLVTKYPRVATVKGAGGYILIKVCSFYRVRAREKKGADKWCVLEYEQ